MLQNGVPQFVGFCRCTPCRQRRGKDAYQDHPGGKEQMHSVQAAPRQSLFAENKNQLVRRCTPCRQRRGKEISISNLNSRTGMHSVQAAPRQSLCPQASSRRVRMHSVQAAPRQSVSIFWPFVGYHDALRAGSAEAKSNNTIYAVTIIDALRAGSAEAKSRIVAKPCITPGMHSVQAAPRQRGARHIKPFCPS